MARTKRSGVTWLELLVSMTIIAILLAMLLPNYTGNTEHARANEAFGNLKLILAGQRVYQLKTGYFLPNAGTVDVVSINQNLRLKIQQKNFTYTAGPSAANTFTATAARLGTAPPPYNDDAYIINETGTIAAQNGGFQPPQD